MKSFKYTYHLIFLLSLQFLFFSSLSSQSFKWQRVYKGYQGFMYDLYGYQIIKSNNGNFFILCAYTQPAEKYLIKINSYGDTLFSKINSGGTIFTGIQTNNGGCIVTGEYNSYPWNLYMTKYNENGSILFSKFYEGTEGKNYTIIKTSDNKYITCGDKGNYAHITKLDSNCDFVWQKFFSTNYYRSFWSLEEANNGDYIAVGEGSDEYTGIGWGSITRFDTSGSIIWDKKYRLFEHSFAVKAINKLSFNNFLIYICAFDTSLSRFVPGFIKINENGEIQFLKLFLNLQNYIYDISDSKIINQNKYIFCFNRMIHNYDTTNANVIITDSLGNILNRNEYSGTSFTEFNKITLVNENDYLFVGESNHLNKWRTTVFAVRTDSSLFAPPPIGINNINSVISDKFILFQNYPNPFNNITNIKFHIPDKVKNKSVNCLITLKLYNILGKEIAILVNEMLHPGTYFVKFSNNLLPSGVYFYRLEVGNFNSTKRMLLIK